MFEKNLSCEMRVIFAVLSILFLFTLVFGKLFAVLGLIITAFVAVTGICLGAKILGPIFCKKSVTDALDNLVDEVKSAADEAVDKAKNVADDVKNAADDAVDTAKNVADDVADKAKNVADDVTDKAKNIKDDVTDTVKDKMDKKD